MAMLQEDTALRIVDRLIASGGTTSDGYYVPPPAPRIDLCEEVMKLKPEPGELIVIHLARPLTREQHGHLKYWMQHHFKDFQTRLIVMEPGLKLRHVPRSANTEGPES